MQEGKVTSQDTINDTVSLWTKFVFMGVWCLTDKARYTMIQREGVSLFIFVAICCDSYF